MASLLWIELVLINLATSCSLEFLINMSFCSLDRVVINKKPKLKCYESIKFFNQLWTEILGLWSDTLFTDVFKWAYEKISKSHIQTPGFSMWPYILVSIYKTIRYHWRLPPNKTVSLYSTIKMTSKIEDLAFHSGIILLKTREKRTESWSFSSLTSF